MNTVYVKKKKNEITIQIVGEFTYNVYKDFRNAYRNEDPDSVFIIDMEKTKDIDSSALGMLLLLRQYAGEDKAKIKVINENSKIKEILNIVRFEDLFNINSK